MASIQSQAANLYHENSSSQAQEGQNLLKKVRVSKGNTVLDLGCGTGYLATILSDKVGPEGRVVAIDPDAERIKIAKEMNARPNIEYLVGDDQSFPGAGYNLVFSNQVIHWIKNKEALFARVYDKLVPGGQFAFVTLDGIPNFPPMMCKALNDLISPDFVNNFVTKNVSTLNTAEYERLAKSFGFEVTSATVDISKDDWNSFDEFFEYWAGVSQGTIDIRTIDQEALQEFKKHHGEELVAEYVPFKILYMVLTKQGAN